mmetsp:Transcript_2634/g.6685  ORF Transcript_2634/g.6685 Transcript_2634/m.6685 type:complete len:338 (-) Transcript_2634:873-1886(-)
MRSSYGSWSIMRQSHSLSLQSSSILLGVTPDRPSRVMPQKTSMHSPTCLLIASLDTPLLDASRSSSLVSDDAIMAARKKSPPSSRLRRLGASSLETSDVPPPALLCDAYVPSARTAGALAVCCTLVFSASSSVSSSTKGREPSDAMMVAMAPSISCSVRQYSLKIHMATRKTLPTLIDGKKSVSFPTTSSRRRGYVSTTSRTKSITSEALLALESSMKSMSTCTTVAAMSGNLMTHEWIACTSIARYSVVFSTSPVCVLTISFLRTAMTSSMVEGLTSSITRSSTFFLMSMLGEESPRMMSMISPLSTSGCFFCRSESLSSTISLTLLSLCVLRSWQ